MIVIFTFLGSLLGLLVGSLPGLSVTMATALLLGLTYSWPTHHAMATIMGVYVVGVYSGAISAILINVAGAPSAIVTTLDGHPLAKKGRVGDAIFYATLYSVIGSIFGLIIMALFAGPLSSLALSFRTIDYFLLALFALSALMYLTSDKPLNAALATLIGLVFSMVGLDPITGAQRFTFGLNYLKPGIPLVPILLGIFGLNEALVMVGYEVKDRFEITKREVGFLEALKYLPFSIYYAVLGVLIGILPGAGTPVASFLSYSQAVKRTREPSAPFGQGAVEGVIAPETANNACVGGALIPMLSMGIPGDGVSAIILSVFMVHGLKPGPLFMDQNPLLFKTILYSGLMASVFMLVLGMVLAPRLSFISKINNSQMAAIVVVLSFLGAYSYNNRSFDIVIMIFFALLGHLLKKFDIPTPPMVLGFILGPMMDLNFRRSIILMKSQGLVNYMMKPITIFFLGLIISLFLLPRLIKKRG